MTASIVVLEGVSKRLGQVDALRNVSIKINSGEIFVLLGPNGSGKSTILKTLSGLTRPDKGRVVLFGSDAETLALRRVGVLGDHSAHWDKLTGYENAWFFARSYGLSSVEASSRLDYFFGWAGLKDRKDDPVATYSYGMRRKLGLIEAMVHQPDLILMDEPTMGLDHSSRVAFHSLLKAMTKRGAAVVLATNDVIEAEVLADRVALVKGGKVLAVGSPSEMIESLKALIRIEVQLASPLPLDSVRRIEGVEGAEAEGPNLRLLTRSGREVLPRIVKELVFLGGAVQRLEVREPNLGDVLTKLADSGDS